ncbi:hypothetical protein [Myxococcus qinghaiensis]|uniref:hypothetical protein n=1 Tax=Myxococcus qinghaiensis TaxID=2906758 RepID=UPI0020A7B84D|nr:hypothetical protein [Myxococcus qinghaiensis]MCP3170068.1 hypothetical protein [Myxococcus qinghaiensis]
MLSAQSPRSWPLALALVGAFFVLPGRAQAQDPEPLSAFELLARSPQLGGSDIPRDLPGRATVGTPRRPRMPDASLPMPDLGMQSPLPAPEWRAASPGLFMSKGEPVGAEASSPEVASAHPEGEPASPSSELLAPASTASAADAPMGMPAPLTPHGVPNSPLSPVPASTQALLDSSRSFKVVPAAVAVVPGLLFHGLAPALAGDGHTARRLFALEGTGLGLIALGGVPIALTGASRRTIAPLYAVTLAGFSVFGISAIANLYSVASPAFDPGVPASSLPPLEFEMGYQYVSDTAFDYDHFVSLGAVARFEEVKLEATARLSPNEGNTQVRMGGAYRLLGEPERRRAGSDGSSLDAELFGLFHRFPTEGFTVIGGDVGFRGRYAMSRVSPSLAGSFAEASIGMALQGYSYPGPVSDGNLHSQLLYSFGYGVWLGRGGGPFKGEAMLFYDHRKDGFAGGVRTLSGGVVGSFGLRARALLTETWGVAGEFSASGALVGRLALVYALGGDE